MILVGPSGSGKSTLLRMIVGLDDITSGDLLIGGQRVNDKAPRDRNLTMVFQNYALYPHLSVFENIAFPLRLKHTPDEQVKRQVTAAADIVDLREHLHRRPGELSGGQRQRVAMGRAIVRKSDAFLFDEPLSNLDATLRGQMRSEILRIQRRLGTTTVYVTHDQAEALALGDRVAVLRKGELQQVAGPRELYEHPANLFVAGFIGSPPMNFLPAEVHGDELRMPFLLCPVPDGMAGHVTDGQILIVGIRPESFSDAALLDERERDRGTTFDVDVDVTEWLGDERYAVIPYEASADISEHLADPEQLRSEQLRTQLAASLDPGSRVRDGERITLWLDPSRILLFDPRTGRRLNTRITGAWPADVGAPRHSGTTLSDGSAGRG